MGNSAVPVVQTVEVVKVVEIVKHFYIRNPQSEIHNPQSAIRRLSSVS
jgi:hypothetical protein